MILLIASSSAVAEYRPFGGAGREKDLLGVNAFCPTFLYAWMVSLTDIPSLPSMMAIMLP